MASQTDTSESNNTTLQLTLHLSPSTISLSHLPKEPATTLIVSARILSIPHPNLPITINTDYTPLDNGSHSLHNGLYRGVFLPLQSLTDPSRRISLARGASPNYARYDESSDLRQRTTTHFETVPSLNSGGELVIRHDLSLERIFQYSHDLRHENVRPGEKFRVRMDPRALGRVGWWAFGGMGEGEGLEGKRFARLQIPDREGRWDDLMPGEGEPEKEDMVKEGWVFGDRRECLVVRDGAVGGCVLEFVK